MVARRPPNQNTSVKSRIESTQSRRSVEARCVLEECATRSACVACWALGRIYAHRCTHTWGGGGASRQYMGCQTAAYNQTHTHTRTHAHTRAHTGTRVQPTLSLRSRVTCNDMHLRQRGGAGAKSSRTESVSGNCAGVAGMAVTGACGNQNTGSIYLTHTTDAAQGKSSQVGSHRGA